MVEKQLVTACSDSDHQGTMIRGTSGGYGRKHFERLRNVSPIVGLSGNCISSAELPYISAKSSAVSPGP
jgi:hypothetical protein